MNALNRVCAYLLNLDERPTADELRAARSDEAFQIAYRAAANWALTGYAPLIGQPENYFHQATGPRFARMMGFVTAQATPKPYFFKLVRPRRREVLSVLAILDCDREIRPRRVWFFDPRCGFPTQPYLHVDAMHCAFVEGFSTGIESRELSK